MKVDFRQEKQWDSPAENKWYTFPKDGRYLIKIKNETAELDVTAGSRFRAPDSNISIVFIPDAEVRP